MILTFPEARPHYAIPPGLRWFARCSVVVAQRTFPGAYGPAGLGNRSRECFREGRGPTARKNAGKSFSHVGSIVTSLYHFFAQRCFVLRQRVFIAFHAMYSGVWSRLWPCFVRCALIQQPHDLVAPLRRLAPATTRSFPHAHWHSQSCLRGWKGARRSTVRLVNWWPVRSTKSRRGGMRYHTTVGR